MTRVPPIPAEDLETIPRMPAWITSRWAESSEDVAFASGAALAHLHGVLERPDVPGTLLRARLAVGAAEACVRFAGRPERVADLRDSVQFLRPGDLAGPAGEICLQWLRAGDRPVSVRALQQALPTVPAEHVSALFAADKDRVGQGAPLARAAAVLETALAADPRAESAALILADAVLARALRWRHVVPLLAAGLKHRDLRCSGAELRGACHRAVVTSASEAVRMAADLARRAAHLTAVAPKLRGKRAGEAVALFLSRDAVAPAELTGLMSDRAARRLCDRLVSLGAVRELTGRETFRLYGV
jgi:hypothetical protein